MVANRTKSYQLRLVEHLYSQVPAFTDVFTEETFYMTAVVFVLSTIVIVFVMSRYIVLKPID